MTVNPLREAAEAAKAVFIDLMTADPSPTLEERLDATLTAHAQALSMLGCLTPPAAAPTTEDLEKAARWLADTSGHHRYASEYNPDGWKDLRLHHRHVRVAYEAARETLSGDVDGQQLAAAYYRMLLGAAQTPAGSRE